MNASLPTRRLVVGLTVTFVLAGCGAGASPTPPLAPTPLPSEAAATPTATPVATVRPTLTVTTTRSVAYESANPVLVPGELDVYAPAEAGRWPVVMLFRQWIE